MVVRRKQLDGAPQKDMKAQFKLGASTYMVLEGARTEGENTVFV